MACGLYFTTEDVMEALIGMATGITTGTQIWPYSTHTVTTRHTAGSTNDKAPRIEEPDECESLTSGSEPAVERATAPPPVTVLPSVT